MSDELLRDIADYCRSAGIAESTFGRLAVNDGKLVGRLRLGGRVTTDTAERVRAFIARDPPLTINGAPTAALWSWPTSTHARRHCASSTPAWATAQCWRAPCGRCTPASRRCRSISSA